MNQRELSCGIFVESPGGVLLAHATGTPRWDLPKGRCEPGETPIEAALRECREETGLDFQPDRDRLVDLGQHAYLRKKDLHLFYLEVETELDLSVCFCSTKIERFDGREVFETDDFAWVPKDQVASRVGKSLIAYLQALKLIPGSPRPSVRP